MAHQLLTPSKVTLTTAASPGRPAAAPSSKSGLSLRIPHSPSTPPQFAQTELVRQLADLTQELHALREDNAELRKELREARAAPAPAKPARRSSMSKLVDGTRELVDGTMEKIMRMEQWHTLAITVIGIMLLGITFKSWLTLREKQLT